MKTHSLPGFSRVPIYTILKFINSELNKQAIMVRANAISFSLFLSLFPTILVLFSLIAYFPIDKNFNLVIRDSILQVMPGNAGKMLYKTIIDVISKQRADLLSLGFALAIFFSSNGMMSLMRGFDKSYPNTFRKLTGFQKRVKAIVLTFMLGSIFFLSIVGLILGRIIFNFLFDLFNLSNFVAGFLDIMRWLLLIFVYYVGIAVIYRYGAPLYRKLPIITAGATFATFTSICTSLVFSFYVENFSNYNKIYGSIGTFIVLMLWIQLNSLILLIGFEINAAIAINKDIRKINAHVGEVSSKK
ncbi:MAG: YihY/virulence factor BrkB family protein [Saprospiraceae bacterium]|nr:YihY/virulence factor BrkB family protein [Saprospiraceae bacterium]